EVTDPSQATTTSDGAATDSRPKVTNPSEATTASGGAATDSRPNADEVTDPSQATTTSDPSQATTTSDGAATDSRPNADEVTDPQATTRPDLTPFLPLNELSTFQTRGAYDRTISRPADATTSGRASHSTINSFVKVSMLPRGAYPAPAPAEDERVFHVFIPDDPNPQTLTKSQLAANLLCNLAGIKLQIDGEKYEILAE
ncbi:hypothetical protein H0H92_000748, partial [Tricholoma furcatifolium]